MSDTITTYGDEQRPAVVTSEADERDVETAQQTLAAVVELLLELAARRRAREAEEDEIA